MRPEAKKVTITGIVANIFLFIIKITVGLMYDSIALISDSFNSLTDIIASIIVFLGVKIAHKKPDPDHPFGHERAEPIAAFIVAIFTCVVGFQIILQSTNRLISGEKIILGILPLIIVAVTFTIKLMLHIYFTRMGNILKSQAIKASAIDHRNDVLISIALFIGIGLAQFGFYFMDPVVAIIVGLYILKAGYDLGVGNIKYLIGLCPEKHVMDKIITTAKSVKGVRNVHDVRAHYVGTSIHAEIHIRVNRALTVEKAHAIGKIVQEEVEALEDIDRAFIHIDPDLGEKNQYRPGVGTYRGDYS